MKVSIKVKLLVLTIVISSIFFLVANFLLVEIIPKKYIEKRIKSSIEEIENIVNVTTTRELNDRLKEFSVQNSILKNIEILSDIEARDENIYVKDEYLEVVHKIDDKLVAIKFEDLNTDKIKLLGEFSSYLVGIFLVIFSIVFTAIIVKFSTKKSKAIGKSIDEIFECEEIKDIEVDILEDEFDNLIKRINDLNKEYKKNLRKLDRERLYKKQLMLSLSHEIKTPIGGINGILEGMLDKIEPYTDRDKYIRECRKLSSRLGKISSEMLDVTKMDSLITSKEEVFLNILFEEAKEEFINVIEEKLIKVEIDIDERLSIFTDERLLKRGIVNIVENAVKYSNHNRCIKIWNEGYKVKIYNECEKLTEDDLYLIFNPLYRGSNSEKANGKGLGLYIVRECFKALDMVYEIKNYKKGVIFAIDLKGVEI